MDDIRLLRLKCQLVKSISRMIFYLDNEKQQILIITGPNMSGKSALLRQTALIVLLAQIGSFVPAESANIGIVDKIFTRVGASDNISSGESTFMVEMNETSSILNNLSNRSLIFLMKLEEEQALMTEFQLHGQYLNICTSIHYSKQKYCLQLIIMSSMKWPQVLKELKTIMLVLKKFKIKSFF